MKNQSRTSSRLPFVKSNEQAVEAFEKLKKNRLAQAVLKGVNSMVILINEAKELVFTSDLFLRNFQFEQIEDIIGREIGALLGCIQYKPRTECDWEKACGSCGVFILFNNKKDAVTLENTPVTIISELEGFILEKKYELSAVTLELINQKYQLVTISDVSSVLLKEQLDKEYFERMGSQISMLQKQFEVLNKTALEDSDNEIELYASVTDGIIQLKESTSFHQCFSEAKNKTLLVMHEKLQSVVFYDRLVKDFSERCTKKGVRLEKGLEFDDFTFYSDGRILYNALVALLENALRASTEKEGIVISLSKLKENLVFSVHNQAIIPDHVKSQVFREGKGLGTYSSKLFIEKYLKGTVYFTSVEGLGTTFYLELPLFMIC
ncbi:MAG: ATP-binding protein [Flavobacteriaceae bacterium]|nr:ATP-binding protein [Flavobacteriaceae bacterium]